MTKNRLGRWSALGVLALLLALVPLGAAQAHTRAQAPGADRDVPPGEGWVRAGHFVAGLGAAEVHLTHQANSSVKVVEKVSYGDVSPYRKMTPGNYTITVRPQSASASGAPTLRRTLTVTAGKAATVAILGTKAAPRLATLSDDLASPAAGTARVRVISGSRNGEGLTIKAINGPLIVSDLVLGQTTPYATVPDGDWTLQLLRQGKSTMQQPITLSSGTVYTAVLLDTSAKGGVAMSLVVDAKGASSMPAGGAATGGGGTAPRAGVGGLLGAGLVGALGLTLLGAGTVGVRRAPRRLTTQR